MTMKNNNNLYFLTNRRNLITIMSGGILGFKDIYAKYSNDILEKSKGFLPLFIGGVTEDAIHLSTNNLVTNFPLLVEIDVDYLPDNLLYLSAEGTGEISGKLDLNGLDASVVLCNEVLEAKAMSCVHFMSEDNLSEFKARILANVPIDNFEFKVNPELFNVNRAKFDSNWFSLLQQSKISKENLTNQGRLADKIAAAIAVLSENLETTGDAILIMSLIKQFDYSDSPMPEEYKILSNVVNTINSDDSETLESLSEKENQILLRATLNVLSEEKPEEGWNALTVLGKILKVYSKISNKEFTDTNESFLKWASYCDLVLSNKKEFPSNAFEDEGGDIIKRSILLLLLRPEYHDYESIKFESLNPGHIVKTISLFLAGYRTGYERLPHLYKNKVLYNNIYSPLKAHFINSKFVTQNPFPKTNAKINVVIDTDNHHQFRCKLQVLGEVLTDDKISIPEEADFIVNKMIETGYKQTSYDMFDNRIKYSFQYEDRSQPIFIDIDKNTIRISSPVVEFTKYKTYETKFTTKVILSRLLKENSDMNGQCYYVYEKGVNISLERIIPVSDIADVNIIKSIEFIAKTADDFEKQYFKQDKVR